MIPDSAGQPDGDVKYAIEMTGLEHSLEDPKTRTRFTLQVPELRIPSGTFCSITGPNGCGKTTLLTILGLLRRPELVQSFVLSVREDQHYVTYDAKSLWGARQGRRTLQLIRGRHLGFVLQAGGLLQSLRTYENIELALRLNGLSPSHCKRRIKEVQQALGIEDDLARKLALYVSGGERQKAAIARATAHRPSIVLVDEPTASLHPDAARRALRMLRTLQQSGETGATVVMVTHDLSLAREFADYSVKMGANVERMRGFVESSQEH